MTAKLKFAHFGREGKDYGHRVLAERIQPGCWILDAGCRGYAFTKSVLQHLDNHCRVIALDPDPAALRPSSVSPQWVVSIQAALMDHWRRRVTIIPREDPLASYVANPRFAKHKRDRLDLQFLTPVFTIQMLMRRFKIKKFAVVKLDIEGCEYDLLRSWPGPIADQITVEFHEPLKGRNPYPDDPERYYRQLFEHLGQWYTVAYHKKSGPMWSCSYWDSLFVLKD